MTGPIKIVIGVLVTAVMLWKLNILEILYMFFWAFIIPLAFLASLGLIAHGTVESMSINLDSLRNTFREQLNEHRKKESA